MNLRPNSFFSIGTAAVESCRLKIRFATGKGLSVSAALALLALAGAATLSVLLHVSLFLKKIVGSTNQPLQSLMSKKNCVPLKYLHLADLIVQQPPLTPQH